MRKIIHIDMDAFFAAIEQRDNENLRGKPVIVGGDPHGRGVVATCSYEARKFGIHSAMPSKTAYQLCPQAIFAAPRFEVYKSVSEQIREIFYEYTDLVEPLSLDEAFLDVTKNKAKNPSATLIAQEIKQKIYEKTRLTASAGVSFNKFLAKIASDWNKPDGLTVITPKDAPSFIDNLPIRKFWGVGKVTEKKMKQMGIFTGADLKRVAEEKLRQKFGKIGSFLYHMARGEDNRPVNPSRERKSLGKENTFPYDLETLGEAQEQIEDLARQLQTSLRKRKIMGRTVTLKVRYLDFSTITRSLTLPHPIDDADSIIACAKELLKKTEAGKRNIRLLGITLSNLQ